MSQELDRSEVPESSPADDGPGHPPVSQHPQDQHQHQVEAVSVKILRPTLTLMKG